MIAFVLFQILVQSSFSRDFGEEMNEVFRFWYRTPFGGGCHARHLLASGLSEPITEVQSLSDKFIADRVRLRL